jgi:hypothetical protein
MKSSTVRRRIFVYADNAGLREIDGIKESIQKIKQFLIYMFVGQMILIILVAGLIVYAVGNLQADSDSAVYLVAILRQAEMHGTVARKMHSKPFPITDPEIKFSLEDIATGFVPSPYPGTLTQLREFSIQWMETTHMPCAAPGGFTAPISLAVLPDHYTMLNVRLFINETLSPHVSKSAVEEKSPTQEIMRVVSRYDEVYVSHIGFGGLDQPDALIRGQIAYCLQMFFSVHDDSEPIIHNAVDEL